MTDLERRALLGDRQAQEEYTRQEILLPCPFCGGEAMIEYDNIMPFEYSVSCVDCGVVPSTSEDKKAVISVWNTRQAPPIGRCASCTHWDDRTCECESASDIEVAYHKYTEPDFFCGDYEPKDGEEDAKS